jgi:hypothetical protein
VSLSAGIGSPVFFLCPTERRERNAAFDYRTRRLRYPVPRHEVDLTGRERPYPRQAGSALGVRSTLVSREYRCRECDRVGWSNHVDLARKATA